LVLVADCSFGIIILSTYQFELRPLLYLSAFPIVLGGGSLVYLIVLKRDSFLGLGHKSWFICMPLALLIGAGTALWGNYIIKKYHAYIEKAQTMNTFNKDGVRFSYDGLWEVSDAPEQESTGGGGGLHFNRSIEIKRSDKDAGVFLSFHPFHPGIVNPSLEDYAKELIWASTGATNGEMERITGTIGGRDQPGLRFHIKRERNDGSIWSGEGDFFLLQNSKCQVIVDTLVVEDRATRATRSSMEMILNSLKIEGMAGVNVGVSSDSARLNVKMIVYKPKGACALIGNRTVMVGDVVQGFTIEAIGTNSIAVKSPTGVKKELRMGDVLN
jgi:hypothetical protein